jgi:hypothetical protein
LRRVVMSLKSIPGFGKSGTSRIRAPRSVDAVATGEDYFTARFRHAT